jgi:hypothetical protein
MGTLASWLKPLEARDSVYDTRKKTNMNAPPDERKIAKAKELVKVYNRTKVAYLLGVSKSTITRWLK